MPDDDAPVTPGETFDAVAEGASSAAERASRATATDAELSASTTASGTKHLSEESRAGSSLLRRTALIDRLGRVRGILVVVLVALLVVALVALALTRGVRGR